MSIKIEGGDGTAENVIKAGTSNELLYNDKDVLLKENFDLDLGLLPDLKKAEEWKLAIWDNNDNVWINNPFVVPKDGWIVKVDFSDRYDNNFIKIDGFGALRMTPSQEKAGVFKIIDFDGSYGRKYITIRNLNCPYPVKKGQVVERSNKYDATVVTFAPCKAI